MKKTIAILQSNYIPWKGYFDIIAKSDVFVIYDEVQYTKNDWRNRNLIKTIKGIEWLTIAVKQDSLKQKIFETEVYHNNWIKKHKGTLQANYAKAKYFKDYKNEIFNIYDNLSTNLTEINTSFIRKICELLQINTEIVDSRDLCLKGDRQGRLIDACKKLNADTYLSGPAAKSYLNEDLFKKQNISVDWMNYSNYEKYNQLFPPFEHGVSILDLIFNEGANAMNYLKTNS